jgi:hypothetical protein
MMNEKRGLRPGGLKRKGNNHSRFDKGFLKINEIQLASEATSLFDPPEADKCLLAYGELDVHFLLSLYGQQG